MLKTVLIFFAFVLTPSLASASPPTSKFDEFSFGTCESLVARLDNFSIAVNEYKTAAGLLYVYGGKVSRKGEVEMYVALIRNYLVKRRGVDTERLRILPGGYREEAGAELWIVPPGASSPDPAPYVSQKEVVFKAQAVKRSRYRCARRPWK